jgi:hypothetical protein
VTIHRGGATHRANGIGRLSGPGSPRGKPPTRGAGNFGPFVPQLADEPREGLRPIPRLGPGTGRPGTLSDPPNGPSTARPPKPAGGLS